MDRLYLNNLQKTSTENIYIYNYLFVNKIQHMEKKTKYHFCHLRHIYNLRVRILHSGGLHTNST